MPRFANAETLTCAWAAGAAPDGRTRAGNFTFVGPALFYHDGAIACLHNVAGTPFATVTSRRPTTTRAARPLALAVDALSRTDLHVFIVPAVIPRTAADHAANVAHLLDEARSTVSQAVEARAIGAMRSLLLSVSRRLVRHAADYAAMLIDPAALALPDLVFADWLQEHGYDAVAHALRSYN